MRLPGLPVLIFGAVTRQLAGLIRAEGGLLPLKRKDWPEPGGWEGHA